MTFNNIKTCAALTIIENAAALGYNDLILTHANKAELDTMFKRWSAEWEARRMKYGSSDDLTAMRRMAEAMRGRSAA